MQLKGLIRFFVILLIVYSVYELSFTWVVKNYEKKIDARAHSFVNKNFPAPEQKYPNNKDSQEVYKEVREKAYLDKRQRLLDSTKDVTVTYGPTGKISYQKAKESELNLGLDLQGGMNVTLQVEMSGLLRALSNNSNDANFQKAIVRADSLKANTGQDFISLFVQEFRKLDKNTPLSSLFSAASSGAITNQSSDGAVENYLHSQANEAFDRTYKVLRTRIDQFGVAQPNINPDRDKAIITVELPGVQDPERVRKQLQASANLQFWEVYTITDLAQKQSIQKADSILFIMTGGKITDTTQKKDTTNKAATAAKQDTTKKDTGKTILAENINNTSTVDTTKAQKQTNTASQKGGKHLSDFIQFNIDRNGRTIDLPQIGYVLVKDSALVRSYLESDPISAVFSSFNLRWMYGVPEDEELKKKQVVLLYAIKTYGKDKAELEGDAITDARQDYDPVSGKVEVTMTMNPTGSRVWAQMTDRNAPKGNIQRK